MVLSVQAIERLKWKGERLNMRLKKAVMALLVPTKPLLTFVLLPPGLRVGVHFALYRYCYIVLRFVKKQSFITKGVSGR